MSKTACEAQCKACPFRNTALPGYLGAYTVSDYIEILWHGSAPIFCHSTINYELPDWLERAERNGQLCRGALIAADAFGGSEIKDSEIKAAQEAVLADFAAHPDDYDVMPVREFRDHHHGGVDRLLQKGPGLPHPRVMCFPQDAIASVDSDS